MTDTPNNPVSEAVVLEPCPNPWCARNFPPKPIRWPVVAKKTTQWAVHCDDCDLYGPVAETEAEAIAAWNTRTTKDRDKELGVCREALDHIAEEGDAEISASRQLEGCKGIARKALTELDGGG